MECTLVFDRHSQRSEILAEYGLHSCPSVHCNDPFTLMAGSHRTCGQAGKHPGPDPPTPACVPIRKGGFAHASAGLPPPAANAHNRG